VRSGPRRTFFTRIRRALRHLATDAFTRPLNNGLLPGLGDNVTLPRTWIGGGLTTLMLRVSS
jgi:hypothetical protein